MPAAVAMSASKSPAPRAALVASAWLLVGAAAGACTITNQDHCFFNDGLCADEGMVCDRCSSVNNGCVAMVDLTEEGCLVPAGSTATTTDSDPTTVSTTMATTVVTTTTEPTTDMTVDPTTETTSTSTTTTSTTDPTGPSLCDPAQPVSPECYALDPSKPYCVDVDTCGGCDELGSSCSKVTGNALPVCDVASGVCVECTAESAEACGVSEVCSPYTKTCGACTEHAQCPKSACNLESGKCMPEANVVWVRNQLGCSKDSGDLSAGTKAKPFCTLVYPLDSMKWGMLSELVIMVEPGSSPQPGVPAEVLAGKTVAIIGQGPVMPIVKAVQATAPLVVAAGATIFIDRLDFSDSAVVDAVECLQESRLWIDRSRIANNGGGLQSHACQVSVRRSVITGNMRGSTIDGGWIRLENTFVTANNVEATNGAFQVSHGELTAVYTTIVDNTGSTFSSGINCETASTATVRNSLLLGDAEPIKCVDVIAEGNFIGAASKKNDLFNSFTDGVYRPKANAMEIDDVAAWKIGDPFVDFDGDLRPATAGSPDWAGADRPKP